MPDVYVWDLESGDLVRRLSGHTNRVSAVAWMEPEQVVSASADFTVRVWHVASGRALRVLEGHASPITGLALSPDGRHAATSCTGNTYSYAFPFDSARIWDLEVSPQL